LAWVCEVHPTLPFLHGNNGGGCVGSGMPCDCAAGRFMVAVLDARHRSGKAKPVHDECVLWRLVGETGEQIVCHAVAGDAGELALTVERSNQVIVAEIASSLDAATARAAELRWTLVGQGLREAS
jgi:hypothetical protein